MNVLSLFRKLSDEPPAMRVLGVVLVFCLEIIFSSTANLLFTPSSDVTLSVMTITDASDEVFVAGGNRIYKLSANLSQLMNVTVSNNTSVSVRGLSLSNGGQYIMACLTTGSCIGYDVIDLNRTMSSVPLNEPGGQTLTGDDPVVMFPGNVEGIVYTGTATDSQQEYRMSLGQYRVCEESITRNRTRDYTLLRTASFNRRIFKAGFSVDDFIYYIVVDDFIYYIVEDDAIDIRILRVCNESTNPMFRALYEVVLTCGGGSAMFGGASILENFLANNTLVLTVGPTGNSGTGRVCTYSMSDINDAMDDGLTACKDRDENRAAVWDTFPMPFNTFCDQATVSFIIIMLTLCYVFFF